MTISDVFDAVREGTYDFTITCLSFLSTLFLNLNVTVQTFWDSGQ